ncbi:MAG: UMP kinase [Bacteroidales bacterium]
MKYKRILLKLSGESLGGYKGVGIDENKMAEYAEQISLLANKGIQIAIVVGGGNIFRGLSGVGRGFDRAKGDQMGMLSTVINSIGLSMAIKTAGTDAVVFTSTPMAPMAEYWVRDKGVKDLEAGKVIIIAGGTGNPFFTTDSASALRACEINADALLKGTRVDGVYTADPEKDSNATKYQTISYSEALSKGLKIMDSTAFALCKDNNMKIIVFDINKKGNLKSLIEGENIGTLIK